MATRLGPNGEVLPRPVLGQGRTAFSVSSGASRPVPSLSLQKSASQPLAVKPSALSVTRPATQGSAAAAAATGSSSIAAALGLKMHFTKEMTAGIMRLFMKYRNQGLVKTAKARDWDKVFDLVLKDARQQWPDAAWRAATVSTKFGNEKTRYRQWAAFYHHPGVSYNPVTGLLEIDREETWTSFLTRNRVSEKSCAWLRSIPLGDAKVYRAVYRESNADGAKVVNADKHVRPHARPAGAGAVPESSRAATGLQHKRKLTHDSNHQTKRSRPAPRGDSSMSDSSSDSQASASGKRSLQDDISTAVELLADGMNALANPRLPSAPALFTEAVTDLYQWRHNITPQQLLLCAKKMENLANARVWILLNDDTVRRELVDQWTKDA